MEVATYLQSARKLAIGLMIMALPLASADRARRCPRHGTGC